MRRLSRRAAPAKRAAVSDLTITEALMVLSDIAVGVEVDEMEVHALAMAARALREQEETRRERDEARNVAETLRDWIAEGGRDPADLPDFFPWEVSS